MADINSGPISGLYINFAPYTPPPPLVFPPLPAVAVQPQAITPASTSSITGIDPKELASATYGRIMPICALGLARLGGDIILGPYFNSDRTQCTFGVSFGVPANPEGNRKVYEIAFDSKVVWQRADGWDGSGSPGGTFVGVFDGSSFTFRFVQGRYDQLPDVIDSANFPDEPVAYRPQMCLFFQDLPVTAYGKRVPFVAAVIGDTTDGADPTDGITLGDALERIAFSPWAGYTSSNFATSGVTDVVDALLIGSNIDFVTMLQQTQRFYRNLDIIQTDKLRIVDRGNDVAADLVVDRTMILAVSSGASFTYSRQNPTDVARELELVTIDPDADYVPIASTAKRPRAPVAVTASIGKDSVSLPIVINAPTRQALVTYAKYQEEQARRRVQLTLLVRGYKIEPGDLVDLSDLGSAYQDETFKVIETTHGTNYVIEVTLESIFKCSFGTSGGNEEIEANEFAVTFLSHAQY